MANLKDTYDFEQIESHYQKEWDDKQTYFVETSTENSKNKFYCLSMFPYPSGQLHMGHVRNYTISDTIARVAKLEGKQVLHPMGWDAFGLPAENAAIKNNVPPADWTYKNIDNMRNQLKRLGLGVDWTKELATCHPEYYKWEQWLFTEMYKKGLVYKKESVVNWDPVDQTVLANEQVIDGKGWRSGAPVERRKIPQWFFKITDYADQLLDDLDELEHWPEGVKAMQRNWIGRSQGAQVKFQISAADASLPLPADTQALEVFTTRPDTLYGVSFIAIAPEHTLSRLAAQKNADLQDLSDRMARMKTSEADMATLPKEGYPTPFTATHPLTGETLPVWVANYVLADYGSGAVMCVAAHDQRDWEFATKYDLPIKPVVSTGDEWDYTEAALTDLGTLINSAEFDGLTSADAKAKICDKLEAETKGFSKIEYRLRDWGISRQRYWGAPIPMIKCESCGDVPVPKEDLPVQLPNDVEFTGEGGSPLAQHATFKHVNCPTCNKPAERETDTFDTFMESSWYYARYTCPRFEDGILSESAKDWTPVDQYVGGIEHATMHLLYSRFLHKVMRDFGYVKSNEPFTRLLCQGMVLSESFFRESEKGEKIYINKLDVDFERDEKGQVIKATEKSTGLPVSLGALEKMSKSKNNGVDPNTLINNYGADTVRLFSMFAAPPEQTLEWSDAGVEGASRFLKRFWKLAYQHLETLEQTEGLDVASVDKMDPKAGELTPAQQEMRLNTHTALQKVTDDYVRRQSFNTGIAALMKLSNQIGAFEETDTQSIVIRHEAIKTLTALLSPIAPHICSEVWTALVGTDLMQETWPVLDESALKTNTITLVVQVNGKKRHEMQVAADASKEDIEKEALGNETVQRFMDGKAPFKVIYVPGRLVNVVVK